MFIEIEGRFTAIAELMRAEEASNVRRDSIMDYRHLKRNLVQILFYKGREEIIRHAFDRTD
jgi:hypothetical protein